jgi:uncharacterized protein YdeI (YjbR/CyaY-like superfamily)
LLKDPKHILEDIGKDTHAGRWVKFTSVKNIATLKSTLSSYLYEAIELEGSGRKVELQSVLNGNAALQIAFEALTPGRRKSYSLHISSAKQAKTRAVRAQRCVPMILSGRGFNELPR